MAADISTPHAHVAIACPLQHTVVLAASPELAQVQGCRSSPCSSVHTVLQNYGVFFTPARAEHTEGQGNAYMH